MSFIHPQLQHGSNLVTLLKSQQQAGNWSKALPSHWPTHGLEGRPQKTASTSDSRTGFTSCMESTGIWDITIPFISGKKQKQGQSWVPHPHLYLIRMKNKENKIMFFMKSQTLKLQTTAVPRYLQNVQFVVALTLTYFLSEFKNTIKHLSKTSPVTTK